ncbi:hypothetical protein Tco_0964926 [Tanacetum coccineum]
MPMCPNLYPEGLFADPTGSVTPFVCWIEDYPLLDGLKMPFHVGSYDGKRDPDNFLHLFEGAIRMQKWLMPVACHMFTYTLKDFARIWWNSQKASSILNYEDLKAKFRSHFSQPTHGFKREKSPLMELQMIRGITLKGQGNLPGTTVKDRGVEEGSPLTRELITNCSLTYLKVQEKSSQQKVTKGSNSSAPVVIKAKIFGREVGRVYMDSGSSCEVIYEHYFLKLKPSIQASKMDSQVPLVGVSWEKS